MKKIFSLLFVLCLLVACTMPTPQVINGKDGKNGQDGTSTSNTIYVNKQIYPNVSINKSIMMSIENSDPAASEIPGSTGGNGYLDIYPADISANFSDGWLYWNNSYAADSTLHVLDLSSLTNGQQALVYIDFSWLDGNQNIFGNFQLRPYNSGYQWTQVQSAYGQSMLLPVLTDATGKIEWKSNCTYPFDAITKDATPGYHAYQYAKFAFTAKWLIVGTTVQ